MKRLLGILFFYILLAVLILPFLVTVFSGGFEETLPQEANAAYDAVFSEKEDFSQME